MFLDGGDDKVCLQSIQASAHVSDCALTAQVALAPAGVHNLDSVCQFGKV
jgi:hypothetical protein